MYIYTNKDRNEFAIGLKEDNNFRAMTKVGEFYTKFVEGFWSNNRGEWNRLETWIRWIAGAAKKNETIFVEVDLSGYNNEVEDSSCPKA